MEDLVNGVLHLLERRGGGDTVAQLDVLAQHPGFLSAVQSIFSPAASTTFDPETRLAAIILFKNSVPKYWRKTADNCVSDEEKAYLREQLLVGLHEADPQLLKQYAVILATIARFDVPHDWPEFLPLLINNLTDANTDIRHKSLLFLYHTVKRIVTRRLASQRRAFSEWYSARGTTSAQPRGSSACPKMYSSASSSCHSESP
eukprot:m.237486 g.237486  ORF g.237486 m.237486 type:complete len:202 (+) comp17108_c0_seq35:140-745(+)